MSDVPNARFWFATNRVSPLSEVKNVVRAAALFLEAERYYDARAAARAILCSEVDMGPALRPESFRKTPAPRVQIRWVGNAARRVPNLRMQIRRIDENETAGPWKDFR